MARKIPRLSSVSSRRPNMDSVKAAQKKAYGKATDVLDRAHSCWNALYNFRQERERNKRYVYGDQWGDKITVGSRTMTESDYLMQQGNVPLVNNLIRRLLRTVNGVYRNQKSEPTCIAIDRDEQAIGETMTVALQANWRKNKMPKVLGRLFEEFLISGVCISKEVVKWRNGAQDCFTMTPHPNYIFFDGKMSDYRLWDMTIIGEIHDLTFNELAETFAHSPAEYTWLSGLYSASRDGSELRHSYRGDTLNSEGRKLRDTDFLIPADASLCRVIEVWTKERKPRLRCHDYLTGDYYIDEVENKTAILAENASRIADAALHGIPEEDVPLIEFDWFIDDYWYFRFLTPYGEILDEGNSPYGHKEHPYTLDIYPMIDGEAHSFVGDAIDQQKYVNRLITLNDWMIRSSTKGLTLFPESAKPEGMTLEQIQAEISRPNGLIFYKDAPGRQAPTQLISPGRQAGLTEMLNLQIAFMEDVTGVTGALQGKASYSGISGSMFAMQQQQASNSLLDLLDTFSSFVRDTALKKVYNIQQSYDSKRMVNISGANSRVVEYDPRSMQNVEFDLLIIESQETPAYRAIMNDYLMQLFDKGAVTIEQLLENGNFPFADRLLQSINAQREKMAQGQAPEPLPADIQQQLAAADPASLAALQQAAQNGFAPQ